MSDSTGISNLEIYMCICKQKSASSFITSNIAARTIADDASLLNIIAFYQFVLVYCVVFDMIRSSIYSVGSCLFSILWNFYRKLTGFKVTMMMMLSMRPKE
jgi:hypothetical protein